MAGPVLQKSIRTAIRLESTHMKRSRACANLVGLEFVENGPVLTKKSKLQEVKAVEFRRQSIFLESEFAMIPGFCDPDTTLALWMEPCCLNEKRICKQ
ncbi:hypothetical protein THRCLA_20225 [Thraustotheca clavata]|uniref:Uncharacterized protein n=1 Tax=Thraustotheca clavata TaxID=74557 RepID=A0A1W0A9V9_9STRA|nr:hypothetical protein THRCLA_20225 [Thraustotheca clavata]